MNSVADGPLIECQTIHQDNDAGAPAGNWVKYVPTTGECNHDKTRASSDDS